MNIAITVKVGSVEAEGEMRSLIEKLRSRGSDELIVFEAPASFISPFPLPAITVENGETQIRHFGSDAIAVLRRMANRKAA